MPLNGVTSKPWSLQVVMGRCEFSYRWQYRPQQLLTTDGRLPAFSSRSTGSFTDFYSLPA